MNPRSPPSPSAGGGSGYPSKRARQSPPDSGGIKSPLSHFAHDASNTAGTSPPRDLLLETGGGNGGGGGGGGGRGGQSSSFRNVSACNRCRLRKNRCDQRLPSCNACEKAGVKCVGYDPITKREIPRSYVFYLESRVAYLENLLEHHGIPYAAAEILDLGSRPGPDPTNAQTPSDDMQSYNGQDTNTSNQQRPKTIKHEGWPKKKDDTEKLNNLVSSISVQGASDPRYLGSTSGISFARVVFAAVKSSVSTSNSEKGGVRPSKPISAKAIGSGGGGGTSMRDSFFGLHTKPTIKQAPFPDRALGLRLVNFYFEHANPQIPILHRPTFMRMFDEAYAEKDHVRTPRELYMLNIVFAIGGGIFLGEPGSEERPESGKPTLKRGRGSNQQCQPEEYHASAIVHLESCLSSPSVADRPDGFGGGLEELQAVLLLAGFALLRPVAPGLWYIIGVAVRLAVDLGLHYEDGKDIDIGLDESSDDVVMGGSENDKLRRENSAKERGRREWIRDFRRRLWWCTYSFDRLVSTCVGRPFGITDQVVTTEFPTLLEDKYITPGGFLDPSLSSPGDGSVEPTYKHVAYHYFRLRLLQSEILQVLQFQQAQQVRAGGANQRNPYMHTRLPSPFLAKFDSFRSWRIDIDRRLWEWKESAPSKRDTGVQFSTEFLELNYWQAVIMLYRQSLSTPPQFEGEYSTSEEVESPSTHTIELREDEDRVFLKVAEAGQRVLRLYRQLHRVHLVNYTFLATHHLFMAGISFLYAIWHSPIVRSRLTMDEVDFTILAATSVLSDLIEKCPPAEACRDAFNRMSKATVQMCMSTTGFSSTSQNITAVPPRSQPSSWAMKQQQQREQRGGPADDDMMSTTPTSATSGMDYLGAPPSNQFALSNSRNQRVGRLQQSSSGGEQHHHHHHALSQQQPTHAVARQKPQFDMGLNDLFPSGVVRGSAKNGTSSSANNTTAARSIVKSEYGSSSAADAFGIPQNQIHSPSDYAISPTQGQQQTSLASPDGSGNSNNANSSAAIDPTLLPHPSSTSRLDQLSPYLGTADPNNNNSVLYNSSYADLDFPLQGMDFLQGAGGVDGVGGGGIGGMGMGGGGLEGQGQGLDLGFGLGWEGLDHDFSEGNQLDLFDGFFFGGTGGY